jgi:hypothetical protein
LRLCRTALQRREKQRSSRVCSRRPVDKAQLALRLESKTALLYGGKARQNYLLFLAEVTSAPYRLPGTGLRSPSFNTQVGRSAGHTIGFPGTDNKDRIRICAARRCNGWLWLAFGPGRSEAQRLRCQRVSATTSLVLFPMLTQRCCISVSAGFPGAEMRSLRLVIVLPEFPSHPSGQPSQFRARSTVALPIFFFFKPPSLLGPSGLIYSYLFPSVSRHSFLSFAVVTTSSSGFLLFYSLTFCTYLVFG